MINILVNQGFRNKNLIVFNLLFLKTLFYCFFLVFLLIDLYFLIPKIVAWIFNRTAELAIPAGAPTSETNVEMQCRNTTTDSRNENNKTYSM